MPRLPNPGGFAAAQLGQTDWELEAEPPQLEEPEPLLPPANRAATVGERLTGPLPDGRGSESRGRIAPPESAAPPPPERILEAMLFIGGPPLTPVAVASAVRGLTAEQMRDSIDQLNKTYRTQQRPYSIVPQGGGYVLAVKPQFRAVKERLFGGPREARLSQPALDALSLVAYRQPIAKGEIEAMRGADSTGVLRQLVRLGLVAVARRADAEGRTVAYGTTPRFLELFHLTSLDDLPRLGDPHRV